MGADFDATTDHLQSGRSDVTFTIDNVGGTASGAFGVNIVHSDDATFGNADDVIVGSHGVVWELLIEQVKLDARKLP